MGRGVRPTVPGLEVPVPCMLTPRGTRPCSSIVGGSFSSALELLGGTALLPPKVALGVSDMVSFTSSLWAKMETLKRNMKRVTFDTRVQK